MASIENACIKLTIRTDYNAILLGLKMNNVKRGPGYWKMNVSVLNNDYYVKEVKQCIAICENEYSNENPAIKWEICKIKG